jgi:pectinesterase
LGGGPFFSSLTGLIPGTTYQVRAYATNSAGTNYGNEVPFTTLTSLVVPSATTSSVSSILVKTAAGGGNVTAWGGASITARGVCWNTKGAPTIADSKTVDGNSLGSFASGLMGLSASTTYFVRAYATTSVGTGYGAEISFSTQMPQRDTTVVVAKNGSGNHTTVQAAFRAVPTNYTGVWTIFVKKGIYYEKDTLAAGKVNVVLMGEDRDSTVITYDDYGDRNGSGIPGTSGSFTISIDANDFIAKNVTLQNTYSPKSGVSGTQAVALRGNGDRQEFINCKILGYQDTYYTWGGSGAGRVYHKKCFIEGTVDFIFGRSVVVFDSCTIHVIRNGGTITAASTDATSQFGYVFRNRRHCISPDGLPGTSFRRSMRNSSASALVRRRMDVSHGPHNLQRLKRPNIP